MPILLLVIIAPNLAWIFIFTGRGDFTLVFAAWIIMDIGLIALAVHNLKTLRVRAAERFVPSSAPA